MKLHFLKKKIDRLIFSMKHLNEFCNNRMHNSSFDQKFGSINHFRQKLMREQYYIDILTQLLSTIFQDHEFEHLNSLDEIMADMVEKKANIEFTGKKHSRGGRTSSALTVHFREEVKVSFNSIDLLKHIKQKRFLCIAIYKLITSICCQN